MTYNLENDEMECAFFDSPLTYLADKFHIKVLFENGKRILYIRDNHPITGEQLDGE